VIAGPRGTSRVSGGPTVVDGGAVVQSSLPLPINREGRYAIRAELLSETGAVVLRSEQVSFTIGPLDDGLGDFVRRSLSGPAGRDANARKVLQTIGSEIKSLLGMSAKAKSAEDWNNIKGQFAALRSSAASTEFSAQARALKGYENADVKLVVTTEPTTSKVFADEFYAGRVVDTIELKMARREWQCAQIVVAPVASRLSGDRVTASSLRSSDGAEIPAADVYVNPVGYVRTTKPPYDTAKVGLWPDPLLPNDPVDLTEGRVQPYWISIRTRGETLPADYEGTVTIACDGASKPLTLALRAKVWDFALPLESRMKTALSVSPNDIYARYTGKSDRSWGDSLRPYWQTFVQPLLDARMGTYFVYSFEAYTEPVLPRWDWKNNQALDFTGSDQAVSHLLKDGYTGFIDICYLDAIASDAKVGSPDYNQMVMRYLDQVVPHVRGKGWIDRCMVFGSGSAAPEAMGEYAGLVRQIKERFPDLRIVMGNNPESAFGSDVDVWVPWMFWFNSSDVRAGFAGRMQAGSEFWWQCGAYNFSGPRWCPIMNIDVCGIDPRIVHWMAWKSGVKGHLYWGCTSWRDQYKDDTGGLWPETEWVCADGKSGAAGDGFLLYPGPDGQPLQSIRFANFRDGLEDYDYFAVLRDAADSLKGAPLDRAQSRTLSEAEKLLAIPDSICEVVGRWTRDAAAINDYRDKLAEAIVNLQKIAAGQ